jgi:ligand-binding sensor domain-containing protein
MPDNTMFCLHCGTRQFKTDARFCQQCGQPIVPAARRRMSRWLVPILFAVLALVGALTWSLLKAREGQAFRRLPEANKTLELASGAWEMFSNGNRITKLAFQDGIVWAATTGGVVAWDAASGRYRKYTTLDGLPDNVAYSIVRTQENEIWAGTTRGVARFNGARWEKIPEPDLGQFLTVTDDGAIWVTFSNSNGIKRFKDGRWEQFVEADGEPLRALYRVAAGRDGSVWVNSFLPTTTSLFHFDSKSFHKVGASDGLPGDDARLLTAGPDDSVWVSQKGKIYRKSGAAVTLVASPAGANEETGFSAAAVAPDGTLWYATYDTKKRTALGLYAAKEGSVAEIASTDNLPGGLITTVQFADDGTAWLGTTQGLAYLSGKRWRTLVTADGVPEGGVLAIGPAADGVLWFAGSESVGRLKGDSWEVYHPPRELTALYECPTIAPNGDIWYYTANSGQDDSFVRFDGTSWRAYSGWDGVTGAYCRSMAASSDGTLWAATNLGLGRFAGDTWQNQPAPFQNVSAVAVAPDGSIWIAGSGQPASVAHLVGADW